MNIRNLQKGERPPPGAKERVIRLAGSRPRPTNKEIIEDVQRKFEITMSDRTIRRYCEEARVPRSTKRLPASAAEKGSADPELGPHARELFYFGQRLRDRLGLLLPLDAAALDPGEKRLNLWSSDVHAITGAKGWALGNYDSRGDLLFASLQQHLAGNSCWTILKQVEDSFWKYQKPCARAYRRVREEVSKQSPALADTDIEAMADSLFVNACYRAEGTSDIAFSYEPHKTQQDDKVWWHLQLGRWGVGHTEDPAALRPLASVHKELTTALPATGEFKELIEVAQAARQAIQQFQRVLSPDALLRKLVLHGRCDLCP
ncbi:MAG: hypothetical protein Q7T05_00715 [Dehalococcoidia bacterium]|nr:hypothetical protein [Dehalococcoidia bacterium]